MNLGEPLTRFTAPEFRCSSFYVKMAISPNDQYLACGSTDKNIYIWEVDYPDVSPIVLKGHDNEVTSLSWSKDFDIIASCSDDASLRIWRIDYSSDENI
nr:2012_t:CDS:2 [Entrophospora candida]CAG8625375.1 592_t:CDS:2 [Entrophospora candida]